MTKMKPILINRKTVKEVDTQGMLRVDSHRHTSCSYDVLKIPFLSPKSQYALIRSFDHHAVFTDHDTIDAFDQVKPGRHLTSGVEIKIRPKGSHIIHTTVFNLDKTHFADLIDIAKTQSLSDFCRYCRQNDLPHVYAHPFWFEFRDKPRVTAIPEMAKLFPVLELNVKRVKKKNELTIRLAEKLGKGLITATDSHTGLIGHSYTLAEGKTFPDFFDNVMNREAYLLTQNFSFRNMTIEFNSWRALLLNETPAKRYTGRNPVSAVANWMHSEFDAWGKIIGSLRSDNSEVVRYTKLMTIDKLLTLARSNRQIGSPSLKVLAWLAVNLGIITEPDSLYENFSARKIRNQLSFL